MSQPTRRGLSLIEVLVVIGIIMVVIGLFFPATRRVRESATRAKCQNNLKQIALAVANYASAYGDRLPAYVSTISPDISNLYTSNLVALVPFMEATVLDKSMIKDYQAWTAAGSPKPPNALWDSFARDIGFPFRSFQCPSDPSAVTGQISGFESSPSPLFTTLGSSNYACNPYLFHVGSVDGYCRYRITEIPDGTSNTVGWCERIAANTTDQMAWAISQLPQAVTLTPQPYVSGPILPIYGTDINRVFPMALPIIGATPNTASGAAPQTCHIGSIQVAVMDGSVRGVTATVSQEAWNLAFSPADGQEIDTSW